MNVVVYHGPLVGRDCIREHEFSFAADSGMRVPPRKDIKPPFKFNVGVPAAPFCVVVFRRRRHHMRDHAHHRHRIRCLTRSPLLAQARLQTPPCSSHPPPLHT